MRSWVEHVGCIETMKSTEFWSEYLKGREHFEDLGVIIGVLLKLILKKCYLRVLAS
jgi:hypothetical protein